MASGIDSLAMRASLILPYDKKFYNCEIVETHNRVFKMMIVKLLLIEEEEKK